MATTSPDGLVSPDAGDPYDLTADMAAMQASTQAALTNRASKSGSNTAMQSAANVRTGTLWFNTTDNRLYRFNGSGWDAVAPTTNSPETITSDLSGLLSSGVSGEVSAHKILKTRMAVISGSVSLNSLTTTAVTSVSGTLPSDFYPVALGSGRQAFSTAWAGAGRAPMTVLITSQNQLAIASSYTISTPFAFRFSMAYMTST